MNNGVFQQDLDNENGFCPGGPFMIQMLFKNPIDLPAKDLMTTVIQKHIGATECFSYDEEMAAFTALDHIAELKEGKTPVQFFVSSCTSFSGESFDDFQKNQMWDCQQDRDRIFQDCQYQIIATDMLAGALPIQERANLDMDFLEALAELFPDCEAFYFQNCGKMFLAKEVRNHQFSGLSRFIRFGVNARYFNVNGTEDKLIDTIGMGTLFLPDFQYHFHDMNPNWVVNHAYNMASYILEHENSAKDSGIIMGLMQDKITKEVQWQYRRRKSLVQPVRDVLDVNTGKYASRH